MKKLSGLLILLFGWFAFIGDAAAFRYGERFCGQSGFKCIRITQGDTWHRLWPNARQREVVQKLNRMNIPLRPGMTIAVPKNLSSTGLFDISPMPLYIAPPREKTVIISLRKLAWGAYDPAGNLVHWAPISGGKSWCKDVGRSCRTIRGTFYIYNKRGAHCVSGKYPLGRGGAPMPYCAFFYRGFAIHGSPKVPGYHASHGCVRTFTPDAQWLSQRFIGPIGKGYARTKVIVQPY